MACKHHQFDTKMLISCYRNNVLGLNITLK